MAEDSEVSQDEKTEEPTQQRLDEFRKEGHVAQSRELTTFFILTSILASIYFLAPALLDDFYDVFRIILAHCATTKITDENIGEIFHIVLKSMASMVLPIAAAGFVSGIVASVVQIGFNFSLKPLEPELSKINPVDGFYRIFSMNSLVEGLKSCIKLVVISGIAYYLVVDSFDSSPALVELESGEVMSYMGAVSFKLVGSITIALLVIAALDLAYQKFRHHRQLMMTKKEMRDELKQREGDPLLRARVRSIQRDLARKRMMEEVPKADVIVTNPTHIAVAIKYDIEKMNAPKVVAKGADFIAQNIKELAKKSNVPIVENVPLARALHKTVKVGAYIPRALYQAVAEVLAYVYRLRGRISRRK